MEAGVFGSESDALREFVRECFLRYTRPRSSVSFVWCLLASSFTSDPTTAHSLYKPRSLPDATGGVVHNLGG